MYIFNNEICILLCIKIKNAIFFICIFILILIFRALLIKIKKMKRINLLAQKLKRTHKLTGRGLRKAHINDYTSVTADQTANTDLISNLNCTNLRKVSAY